MTYFPEKWATESSFFIANANEININLVEEKSNLKPIFEP